MVIAAAKTEILLVDSEAVDMFFIVSIPLWPCKSEPITMNIDDKITAYFNFINLEATGGPKTFAASFAPRAQPKNNAGIIKTNIKAP